MLLGLVFLVSTLLSTGMLVLSVLLWTALVLLLVDAARNLRSINDKVGKT
jgi:hypothetical protein